MKTARAMVDRGFVKAGYRYLNIGDGWSAKERDEKTGSLFADAEKLGGSLRSLSVELGSLGIKLAIVTSGGTRTPNGYPGSFGHEYEDAEFFAENGVAMIAQDFSALPRRTDPVTMIRRTGLALRAAGDSIVYSVYAGT
ncbi:MAG: glycoside hydrolase family 27 protein, partial [Clostridia bacterium]|nr:glycoside hydrolase family 27 protein [Clostridia bacterium]